MSAQVEKEVPWIKLVNKWNKERKTEKIIKPKMI